MEIRGRFLPSRVYSRWKWTVRFGLLLVPFLIFLSGGLILFLTPDKYRSSTLFSLENGPPPREIVELIESRGVLERVVEQLELANQLNVDRDTAMGIVHEASSVKSVPDTNLVEITVTVTNKVRARDIAGQIPICLRDYLVEISQKKNKAKAGDLDQLIRDASDVADEKAAAVTNLEKVHGANPADTPVITTLERARRTSLLADAEVERLQNLRSECLAGNLETLPRLDVHSAPVISDTPFDPKIGLELNLLAAQSLVAGLIAALLLPYLMELASPPRADDDSGLDLVDNL
jgi:uncharacterized protein involved in exopolysaccharide biosynthesis